MNVVLVRRVKFKVSPEIQTSISFNLNARKYRLKSCYNDRLVPERKLYWNDKDSDITEEEEKKK